MMRRFNRGLATGLRLRARTRTPATARTIAVEPSFVTVQAIDKPQRLVEFTAIS